MENLSVSSLGLSPHSTGSPDGTVICFYMHGAVIAEGTPASPGLANMAL